MLISICCFFLVLNFGRALPRHCVGAFWVLYHHILYRPSTVLKRRKCAKLTSSSLFITVWTLCVCHTHHTKTIQLVRDTKMQNDHLPFEVIHRKQVKRLIYSINQFQLLCECVCVCLEDARHLRQSILIEPFVCFFLHVIHVNSWKLASQRIMATADIGSHRFFSHSN